MICKANSGHSDWPKELQLAHHNPVLRVHQMKR